MEAWGWFSLMLFHNNYHELTRCFMEGLHRPMLCGCWPMLCGCWPMLCGCWPVLCGCWGLFPVAAAPDGSVADRAIKEKAPSEVLVMPPFPAAGLRIGTGPICSLRGLLWPQSVCLEVGCVVAIYTHCGRGALVTLSTSCSQEQGPTMLNRLPLKLQGPCSPS